MEECLSGARHLQCLAGAFIAEVFEEILIAEFVQIRAVIFDRLLLTALLKALVFLIEQLLEFFVFLIKGVELVDLLRLALAHLLRFAHRLFHFTEEFFLQFFPGDLAFLFGRRLRLLILRQRDRYGSLRYECGACSDPGSCQAGQFGDFSVLAGLFSVKSFRLFLPAQYALHFLTGEGHGVFQLVLVQALRSFAADAALDLVAGDRSAVRCALNRLFFIRSVSAEHILPVRFDAVASDAGCLTGAAVFLFGAFEKFIPGVRIGRFQPGALRLFGLGIAAVRPQRRL